MPTRPATAGPGLAEITDFIALDNPERAFGFEDELP